MAALHTLVLCFAVVIYVAPYASAGPDRSLLVARQFSNVAKDPSAPRLTRKNFERATPLRHLQAVRQFDQVANHKTPQAPRLTRKTFERMFPLRMLLSATDAADMSGPDRPLLVARQFSNVAKDPSAPRLTRKNFERATPLRHLQAARRFDKVANHKTPQTPRLTRKTFERMMAL